MKEKCDDCHQEDGIHKMSCPTKKLLCIPTTPSPTNEDLESIFGDYKKQINFEDYIEEDTTPKQIKPIFVVRFPKSISPMDVEDIKDKIITQQGFILEDYHILVLRDPEYMGKVEFECFNSPHTEIEFNELKEKLEKYVKN
jgi:hypothetical protein